MSLYVLQYEGISLISFGIRAATWSSKSHSAIANGDTGWIIEAWHKGGVTHEPSPWANHTPETMIDVYEILGLDRISHDLIWHYSMAKEGLEYDFQSILGFLPGLRWLWRDDLEKYFCSHLVADSCKEAGEPLFSNETPLYKVSPGKLAWSPRLKKCGTVRNYEEWDTFLEKHNRKLK